MKLNVIAHLYAGEGQEVAVREVLESIVAPTRLEDGCLRYDLFVDVADPCRFTFIEEWTSSEALQVHSRAPHILAARASNQGRMREPNKVISLRQIL